MAESCSKAIQAICARTIRSARNGSKSRIELPAWRCNVMSQSSLGKMHFTRMDQGTDEDFQVLKRVHERTVQQLPAQLMGLLDGLGADTAYNITRRDHCLQS